MKLLSFFPKKEELQNKLRNTVLRFPLACLISVVVTLIFFILIASNLDSGVTEILGKIIMAGIITFFLSTGVTLFGESINKGQKYIFVGHIASIIFGIVFYYFLSPNIDGVETITYFLLTLFGVVSILFSAPYVQYIKSGKYKISSYYIYFYRVSTVLFVSCIVGLSLALGGSLAILTVQVLFDIGYSWSDDMYGYWIATSLVFLTPLFALSELPNKGDFENTKFHQNIFFNFLVKYIATTFIYIYFFILYVYTLKVLINFNDWPKGEVSWMVIGFSSFGYITYMFSYIFETKKDSKKYSLILTFRKYFPYVVLPQIAMLFYAIFLRIGQYDLTMNRYFVVVFGIWLLVTSIYLIISKAKSILFIPTLLTLFTIIISIGPWSVYHLPLIRQTARLENNLKKSGILISGIITPLNDYSDIDKDLSNQIYDGIEYLCGFDNCKKIKDLFPEIYSNFLKNDKANFVARQGNYSYLTSDHDIEYSEPSSWNIVSHIASVIKVQRTYNWSNNYNDTTYHIYSSSGYFPLDITGYDYAIELNSYETSDNYAKTNIEEGNIVITIGDIKEVISIDGIFDSLRENHDSNIGGGLTKEERKYPFETNSFTGVFILQSAEVFKEKGYVPNQDSHEKEYLYGLLLISKK